MRDWRHENTIRALAGHAPRALCPDCGAPTKTELGDCYAPRVRLCGHCGWDDYASQLDARIARASDESALYGDAHGSEI